ncbi:MAG: DUF4185 domain-containing protein [Nitriliruptorales bacterium]
MGSPAIVVAQLTGPGSINRTDERWNVHGTDLGHLFEHEGQLVMVFGDTFGPDKRDWRSSALARLSQATQEGLLIGSMVTDERGWAREILPSRKVDRVEHTVIPTNGVSAGPRMFLHAMSVRTWGTPGRWECNHALLAYSDNGGERWDMSRGPRWGGDSNFVQVAFVPQDDEHVFVFGIPAGRFGGVQLARVPGPQLLDVDAYRYWDGSRWQGDARRAETIVPAPVGELSVRWNDALGAWLMAYLDEHRAAIVFRAAPSLTGPWGRARVVAEATDYPQLYAPYFVPGLSEGHDVHFTMSMFGPYNVFLMRVSLPQSGL